MPPHNPEVAGLDLVPATTTKAPKPDRFGGIRHDRKIFGNTFGNRFQFGDRAERELDEAVGFMNADRYLMTNRLPGMNASNDQAMHELSAALTALKAAERGGADRQIECGQWGRHRRGQHTMQVTGSNIAELSNILAAGLAIIKTAISNMTTVLMVGTKGRFAWRRICDPSRRHGIPIVGRRGMRG
jgi:hypothetical protein